MRPARDPKFVPVLILTLAGMAVLQYHTAALENQAYDEAVHIAAGVSYWSTGDHRLNIEHPPLAKLLFALPPMARGVRFDTANPNWVQPDQTALGRELLYRSRLPADTILALSRAVTMGFTALLGAAMALWARRRFGLGAGLAVLAMYALDPTFLAHGRYATTDVPVACLSFLSVIAWVEWLDGGRRRWLAAAAILFGLAAATKFSGLYMAPVHVVLALWMVARRRRSVAETVMALVLTGVATAAICSAVYGWNGMAGRGPDNFAPGHPYVTGLRTLAQHNQEGHAAYLLGSVGSGGRWEYFPVAFAVKSPVGMLVLLSIALLGVRRVTNRYGWLIPALLAYPGAYFGLSMASNINIGVRHLLPAYPLLFVLVGTVWSVSGRMWKGVAVVALIAIGIEDARVYPDYLAFFNAAAGGTAAGPRYLLDSNIDWGQDVKKLKRFMDERGIESIAAALFTNADLSYYGIRAVDLPVDASDIERLEGWVAISVTELYDVYREQPRYGRLRQLKPVARVGGSIYVYDLRRAEMTAP